MSSIPYRPEIDGLRAISVILVVLFHAGFAPFSGGYLGIDVFFVISGYLITTIILVEKKRDQFSLINFYARRVRRILPALFFALSFCVFITWLYFPPHAMKDFAQSLTYVSLFSSNMYFYKQVVGYFDITSDYKLLLHTWSLAVEEQFYLFFPMLILILWRFGQKILWPTLFFLAIVSLLYANHLSTQSPTIGYYILPARIWELGLGAMISPEFFIERIKQKYFSKNAMQFLGFLGAFLLFSAVFFFNKRTLSPIFITFIIAFSTALIILFADKATIIGQFLSYRILVGIGLISYGAYLWHQPLLVWSRFVFKWNSIYLSLGLIAIAFICGYVSYRFIEIPVRKKEISLRKTFLFGFCGTTIFFLIGTAGVTTNGFENRFTESERALDAFNTYPKEVLYRQGKCFLNSNQDEKSFKKKCNAGGSAERIMVWGDSYAAGIFVGFRKIFNPMAQYASSFCPPVLDVNIDTRPYCSQINNFIINKIKKKPPAKIYLHANWIAYGSYDLIEKLSQTLDVITASVPASTKIIVLGGLPQWRPSLPNRMIIDGVSFEDGAVMENLKLGDIIDIENKISKMITNKKNIQFISVIDKICEHSLCRVVVSDGGRVEPIVWDHGHLTEVGANWLAQLLKNI